METPDTEACAVNCTDFVYNALSVKLPIPTAPIALLEGSVGTRRAVLFLSTDMEEQLYVFDALRRQDHATQQAVGFALTQENSTRAPTPGFWIVGWSFYDKRPYVKRVFNDEPK